MIEKLRERLEMQEGSSSLLASTSACCDSAIIIPDNFILPSRFMLLCISETAKRSFRQHSGVRNAAGYSITLKYKYSKIVFKSGMHYVLCMYFFRKVCVQKYGVLSTSRT